MKDLSSIVAKFKVQGTIEEIKPLGAGLINDTYKVNTKEADAPDYVLQRINHAIFQNVEMLQSNISAVTNHIRKKLTEAGESDIDRKVLSFLETEEGKTYWFDGDSYWRVMVFIPRAKTYETVNPEYSNYAGEAFGNFQAMLADIPETLGETIPDFHNMEFRLKQLHEAVAKDAAGRVAEVKYYLDEIEKEFQTFQGPVYHVLGNHDMDSISKEDFLQHTSNHGDADKKTYYSFICNDIKFIVLDANHNLDGTPYDRGSFDWTKAFIPKDQVLWLQEELKEKDKPVVIFIHQLLDRFSDIGKALCVSNADEIVSLLEANGNILAVFQGHHHAGHYSFRNNIHYWTMKGMIEGSLPENNSFAVIEIDKDLNIYIEGFYNCKNKEMKHNR